jgi:hypothetical protein
VKRFIITIVLVVYWLITSTAVLAQSGPTEVEFTQIVLIDNMVYLGKIVSESDTLIMLKTLSDEVIRIQKSKIKKRLVKYGIIRNGNFWHKDPNTSRLFFSPTARPLGQGNAYLSVIQIFFPFAAFGINDVLTFGGGISLFPGAKNQILYAAPKVTFVNSPKVGISGGVLYLSVSDDFNAGILYGVSSFGNSQKFSFTFGMGYGFAGNNIAENPILLVGFERRLSRSIKFISENWIVTGEDESFLSFGIRVFGEKLAADLALIRPIGNTDLNDFPFNAWLGFAYNF